MYIVCVYTHIHHIYVPRSICLYMDMYIQPYIYSWQEPYNSTDALWEYRSNSNLYETLVVD